jgi:hypothetical protein
MACGVLRDGLRRHEKARVLGARCDVLCADYGSEDREVQAHTRV